MAHSRGHFRHWWPSAYATAYYMAYVDYTHAMIVSTVRRSGNSIVVSIPREELEAAGVQIGDQVSVTLRPIEIRPRLRADLQAAVDAEILRSAEAFDYLANH